MAATIADAYGRTPQQDPIITDGPPEYHTSVDNELLLRALQESGTTAAISADAGLYVCNATIYQVMHLIAQEHLPIRYTFLHTPWTESDAISSDDVIKIPTSDLHTAIVAILQAMATMG
jgi:pyroglutamyl-peptidase